MADGATVAVRGYTELLRALRDADRNTRLEIRHALRDVGELVRSDAAVRFAPIDAGSAAGYKVRVRQRGVAVEQSLRRTTGKHPQYGALQMRRALVPALHENEAETIMKMNEALEKVARIWNAEP